MSTNILSVIHREVLTYLADKMKQLLVIAFLVLLAAWPAMAQPGANSTAKVSPDDALLFKAGTRLGTALADRCSIFSGLVVKVGPLTKEDLKDGNAVRRAIVTVRIDEWLWNQRRDVGKVIELDQTVVPERQRFSSEGASVWDDVDVRVGSTLTVALRRDQDGPRKYGFVESDVNLFPLIDVALSWHRQYLATPGSMVSAAAVGGNGKNPFFLGYFVTYLWRGGSFGSRDEEAIALGKLLAIVDATASAGSAASVRGAVPLIRITLLRLLLSDSNPLSKVAQRLVTENVVIAGGSEDLRVAEDAINILVRLAAKGKLELAPYLTAERRRKLTTNYRALMEAGKIDKNHMAFGSQLPGTPQQ
jgi:hypothetical protein